LLCFSALELTYWHFGTCFPRNLWFNFYQWQHHFVLTLQNYTHCLSSTLYTFISLLSLFCQFWLVIKRLETKEGCVKRMINKWFEHDNILTCPLLYVLRMDCYKMIIWLLHWYIVRSFVLNFIGHRRIQSFTLQHNFDT
jgi:hypothetical protein